MNAVEDEELITPPAISRQLGVSHQSVLNYIASGKLPAIKVLCGKVERYKVRKSDLEKFIAERM